MHRHRTGDGRTVVVAALAALALCTPASASAAQVTSTFDSGDDGWRVVGDTTSTVPEWRSTGGNPGGFVRTHDRVVGGVMWWSAPAKFRGDLSSSYGERLSFDLRQSAATNPFSTHDVRIVSPGLTLHFDHSPDPSTTAFTHYSIRLDETAGWYRATSPRTPATKEDVLRVLRSVTALEIRAEFETGPDSDDLDNVVLERDLEPPETTIDEGPPAFSPSPHAAFRFSADGPASFDCRLDGADLVPCTSPRDVTGLGDGPHTFAVRATDAAGNADPTPATWSWTVDTDSPETTVTDGPDEVSHSEDAVFELAADEEAATFECRLDGADWAPCDARHEVHGLEEGDHVLLARAADRAGNRDATPAEHRFVVDLCPALHHDVELPDGTRHVCL